MDCLKCFPHQPGKRRVEGIDSILLTEPSTMPGTQEMLNEHLVQFLPLCDHKNCMLEISL